MGFEVTVIRVVPPALEFREILANANQLWLISTCTRKLTDRHLDVIMECWESGLGLYIAGDNDPYHVDANLLLLRLQLPQMMVSEFGCASVCGCESGCEWRC